MIKVYEPDLTGNESKYLQECISSTWISSRGAYIDKFEKDFTNFTGTTSTTVSSGTTALHLALWALGITVGDEVLVPTLTYVASANAISFVGAKPIFVDSNEKTWQIEVNSLAEKLTPKTKAVIVVHLYGHACDLSAISSFCKNNNLLLIEDCAEALGTTYGANHVGQFCDASTYSFFGNKTITTGEGGMVCSNKGGVIELAKKLKNQGVSKTEEYWHDIQGHNFRMTNVQAAIGCAQIERIDNILKKKRGMYKTYKEELSGLPVIFQNEYTESESSCWMTSILTETGEYRDQLRRYLAEKNIETRPLFKPLHTLPFFYDEKNNLPVATDLSARGINLPSGTVNSERNLEIVIAAIKSFYQ